MTARSRRPHENVAQQDGPDTGFAVYRASAGTQQYAHVGEASETTTFVDRPGQGDFSYFVVPDGGVSPESYKLQIHELLDDQPPRWTYDTGMGLQSEPAEGDKRADWDYEWTYKPVAWDIDVHGRVIDDTDSTNPGLEVMIHAEWGDAYALFDARTGKRLWKKEAPGKHLQLNVAVDITGSSGLDIVGTFGGHRPQGGLACKYDGTDSRSVGCCCGRPEFQRRPAAPLQCARRTAAPSAGPHLHARGNRALAALGALEVGGPLPVYGPRPIAP